MISTALRGRNARPVLSGEKREVLLQEVGEEQKHREDAGAGQQER